MQESARRFIPAAGYDVLLPLYDPMQRWLIREEAIKRQLIEQAALQPGHRVLDIGCGTGSLTLLLKRLRPDVQVFGMDPDPKALTRAVRKAETQGVAVQFERGFADRIPNPDLSFDAVFSSLMLHHLTREEKLATLREVLRVLRPGGSLHVLDFGPPRTRFSRALAHLFHHTEQSRDNIDGSIPALMSASGLLRAQEVASRGTLVGSVSYYRGFRPATD